MFNRENLSMITNSTKNGIVPAYFTYHNESYDTVTASGFFVDYRLAVGDSIRVLSADYLTFAEYSVSAVSSGAATVVAQSTSSGSVTIGDWKFVQDGTDLVMYYQGVATSNKFMPDEA